MSARFVVVPQWQGSSSSRAMRLIDGAEAIRGDLPIPATVRVDVPSGAGDDLGTGIRRLSALVHVRERMAAVLRGLETVPVVIGGDCGVELGAVEHAVAGHVPDTAVIWLGAHPGLHTPESSPTGAFHTMVLRTLLGDGDAALVPAQASRLQTTQLVLAGTRSADPAETDFMATVGIRQLSIDALSDPGNLVRAAESTGATRVYIHVSLDVLDPSEISGLDFPEPFGVSVPALTATIRALRERFTLAGAGITDFAPPSIDAAHSDLSAVLRILSALTRPLDR